MYIASIIEFLNLAGSASVIYTLCMIKLYYIYNINLLGTL